LETNIEIAKRLGYIAAETAAELIDKNFDNRSDAQWLAPIFRKKRNEVQRD